MTDVWSIIDGTPHLEDGAGALRVTNPADTSIVTGTTRTATPPTVRSTTGPTCRPRCAASRSTSSGVCWRTTRRR